MPASPDDGARLAARILEQIHDVETALLAYIASRVRTGINGPDWATLRLAEIQLLQRRIASGLQRATPDILNRVQSIVHDAYNHGQALAVVDIQDAGLTFSAAPDPLLVVDRLASDARLNVQYALSLAPDMLTNVYRQAVQAGAAEVLGGQVTRLQAAQHVLDQLGARGITGYRDRAGRNWSLESYVEMAVRTAAGNAAVQGHADTLAASGVDLVIVSDAPRECPLCRPWERRVLSLSGQVGRIIEPNALSGSPTVVDVAGTLEEARAAGLQHPNCRHTISMYTVGVTKHGNATAEPDRYDAGQRQREMERNIRAWKRRQALALDNETARRAATKVRDWQAALREHIDQNELTRLRRREQIGQAL
jgi:hypothetical protein